MKYKKRNRRPIKRKKYTRPLHLSQSLWSCPGRPKHNWGKEAKNIPSPLSLPSPLTTPQPSLHLTFFPLTFCFPLVTLYTQTHTHTEDLARLRFNARSEVGLKWFFFSTWPPYGLWHFLGLRSSRARRSLYCVGVDARVWGGVVPKGIREEKLCFVFIFASSECRGLQLRKWMKWSNNTLPTPPPYFMCGEDCC